MADHGSGPRALADPVVDITDMYVFPSPEQPGRLVLALDVFPFAGPGAVFSDAVDYRFRIRSATVAGTGAEAKFDVGADEYVVSCTFDEPNGEGASLAQTGTCATTSGASVRLRRNDDPGSDGSGIRAYAGRRMDPFFFDGVHAVQCMMTGELSFEKQGTATTAHQNILSVIVEIDAAELSDLGPGSLFAVVGETATRGSVSARLERFGRPEIKNLLLMPKMFDALNHNLEIRDLFNQEDAFAIGPTYLDAYRARLNGTLTFWDNIDQQVDWPVADDGTHPLTELLLADFMVVDTAKPYAEDSCFEIERSMLKGIAHETSGGRSPNDDSIDTLVTLVVNADNGPRISDGIDEPPTPTTRTFPYLLPPEPDPPAVVKPSLRN